MLLEVPMFFKDPLFGGYCAAISQKHNAVVIHGCAGCMNLSIDKNFQQLNIRRFRYQRDTTYLTDKNIIEGGIETLYKTICRVFECHNPQTIIVLTNYTAEIIGDSVDSICNKATSKLNIPVLDVQCGDLDQSFFEGYKNVLKKIICSNKLLPANDFKKLKVNIFGLYPYIDPYFHGNKIELTNIFARLNIDINFYSGEEYSLDNIHSLLDAQLNISFGSEYHDFLDFIKNKYGIPYIEKIMYPIGINSTIKFLEEVCTFFNISILNDIDVFKKEYYGLLIDSIEELKKIQNKSVGIIGISPYAFGIKAFLEEELNMYASQIYCIPTSKDNNSFDFKTISDDPILKSCDYIFGRFFEQKIFEPKSKVIPITPVIRKKIIYPKAYIGLHGALAIIQDMLY